MLSRCIIRGHLRDAILKKDMVVYALVMPTSSSLHRMQLSNASPYAESKQLKRHNLPFWWTPIDYMKQRSIVVLLLNYIK